MISRNTMDFGQYEANRYFVFQKLAEKKQQKQIKETALIPPPDE